MTRPRIQLAFLVALAGLSVACVAQNRQTVAPVEKHESKDGPDPMGPQEGDSVPELELRLDRLTTEQSAYAGEAMGDAKACQDLCSLSASLCEVQVKLCDIADSRPSETSYQNLCREAQHECNEAQNSCEACVDELQNEPPKP